MSTETQNTEDLKKRRAELLAKRAGTAARVDANAIQSPPEPAEPTTVVAAPTAHAHVDVTVNVAPTAVKKSPRPRRRSKAPTTGPVANPPAPATPAAAPAAPGAKSPEEIANDSARQKYFELLNKKVPKVKGLTYTASPHDAELAVAEAEYQKTKSKIAESFARAGNEAGARKFLLGEIRLKKQNKIENSSLTKRSIDGIKRGITAYENFGHNPADGKWLRAVKQTGKVFGSIAIIGGTSAGVVALGAFLGAGSAAALSGGIGSYMLRRTATSGAFAVVASKLPDPLQKIAGPAMIGFSALTAALPVAVAGGLGYGASKLAVGLSKKWWSKEVTDKKKTALDANTVDWANADQIKNLESEYEKIEAEAATNETKTRWLATITALGVGVGTLETMGYHAQNVAHAKQEDALAKHNAELKAQHDADVKQQADLKAKIDTQNEQLRDLRAGNPATPGTPDTSHAGTPGTNTETITTAHGAGGIQEIRNLKAVIREHYHGDYSHAPKDIQGLMSSNLPNHNLEYAEKLGLYHPGDTNESALLQEGSTFKVDYDTGNISIHNVGAEHILMHGNNTVDKYDGQMFHSGNADHSSQSPEAEHAVIAPEIGNPHLPAPTEFDIKNIPGAQQVAGLGQPPMPYHETQVPAHSTATPANETLTHHTEDVIKTGMHKNDTFTYNGREAIITDVHKDDGSYEIAYVLHPHTDSGAVITGRGAGGYNTTWNTPQGPSIDSRAGVAAIIANKGGYGYGVSYGSGYGNPAGGIYDSIDKSHTIHIWSGISPEENTFLSQHLDFIGKNPYHLDGPQLVEAYNTAHSDIGLILHEDMDAWNHMKGLDAYEFLHNKMYQDAYHKPLLDHLKDVEKHIHDATGEHIEPKPGEKIEAYLGRQYGFVESRDMRNYK